MTVHQEAERSVADTDGGAMGPASVCTAVLSFRTPALLALLGASPHNGPREYGPAPARPACRPRGLWSICPAPG
ncbi:hypothetical protein ACO0M4_30575 [Streptomyces sp. RGM 3693]|uniref:hypothetical protein n=1 Tax=Streptomyces sp. RGM 3693 TaxID=3413284 RepID=UPI003D28161C